MRITHPQTLYLHFPSPSPIILFIAVLPLNEFFHSNVAQQSTAFPAPPIAFHPTDTRVRCKRGVRKPLVGWESLISYPASCCCNSVGSLAFLALKTHPQPPLLLASPCSATDPSDTCWPPTHTDSGSEKRQTAGGLLPSPAFAAAVVAGRCSSLVRSRRISAATKRAPTARAEHSYDNERNSARHETE